jgi:peptidoglycan-associated lipoprotein
MKKILLSITLIVCFAAISQKSIAQYILKQADEEYKLFNYTKAVGLYLKAYEKKKTYYTANHIANSYRVMQDYAQTETWYAIVVAMPEATPDDINKYAEALRNNAKYEEAKVQYTRYYTLKKELNKNQLKVLLASCDSAVRWMKSPKPVEVTNEQLLNTVNSDWGSALYQGNLVFASDRNTRATSKTDEKKPLLKFDNEKLPDTKTYEWTGNNYVKLYEAAMGDSAKRFPLVTGTDYHVGPASFTADGNEMYFTITRPNKNWDKDTSAIKTFTLEIYSSKKVNNVWGKPVAFKYNNPKWSVGDPFVTPDGKKLYFVSNMPDGVGGTDIYYSLRDASGNWNLPVNLKVVNTQGNERTPVVDSVNTIYFSSDSGIGMGGLDIFKAIPSGDTYGVRQNLGFPVNSPRDDLAYVLTSPTTGYFSSNREKNKLPTIKEIAKKLNVSASTVSRPCTIIRA